MDCREVISSIPDHILKEIFSGGLAVGLTIKTYPLHKSVTNELLHIKKDDDLIRLSH